jgi:hypothetical protein
MPEFLHKDGLQYELEAHGVSTEGLNVAAFRSLFRTSRHLKENPVLNSGMLMDLASILSFCRDQFNQSKNLVDNADRSRIGVDFPRYMHRLCHVVTRL